MSMPIEGLVWLLISAATLFLAIVLRLISIVVSGRRNRKRAVGFFHPYTNDGGGGERVLWCAVKAIQEENPDLDCFVYTGDHDASSDSLMARSVDRFGVKLLYPPKVVHLYKRKWIEERTYPRFTMIGQSLGSVYLAWEALQKFTPLYYFDTSGYAFTYPVARLFGCKVICYTHYPTMSLDMLSRVHAQSSMYNNDSLIAKRYVDKLIELLIGYAGGICLGLVSLSKGQPGATKFPLCAESGEGSDHLDLLYAALPYFLQKTVSTTRTRDLQGKWRQPLPLHQGSSSPV